MKTLTYLASLLICLPAIAKPLFIDIEHQKPANLFQLGQPVKFNATVKGMPQAATGEAKAVVTDFYGQQKTVTIPVDSNTFTIDLGTPEPGYYDLKVTLKARTADGKEIEGDSTVYVTRLDGPDKKFADTDPVCFGVVRFVDRTAEQVRQGGYRFGLKVFQIGDPGVWWRRSITYNVADICDASRRLGLQWTRHTFNQGPSDQPGVIATLDLINNHQMNVVLKVEGFPESCYDSARYGPLDEWKKKHPRKSFSRSTVPAKEPYQAWMRQQLSAIPPEQNIYEIGNEVWDYMSGKEFAEWCRMCVEVIKEVNPNAKIGADPSSGRMTFALPFFEAGGMNGMDIVYSHPYSFTPLPEWRIRPWIRNLKDMVADHNGGRRLDVYVTEYGWPTAPKDTRKHSVSETVQAQRTVRQSILMYAEDVKVLIPHWMADREYDITERENWFGFFRLSGQPKPVLIAHANCARLIDGGTFVGDLWQEPGLASMLFEKDGKHLLALWTAEEPKQATIDVGVSEVTVVDLMGRETVVKTDAGRLTRTFDASVTYLVGVNPTLAAKVTPPTAELNPEMWSVRAQPLTAPRGQVTLDGKLDEWTGKPTPLAGNAKVGQAEGFVRWDEQAVYVAMRVKGPADERGIVRIGLSANPGRTQSSPSYHDRQIALSVAKDATSAKVTLHSPDKAQKPLEQPADGPIRYAVQPTEDGYTIEVAIPAAVLGRALKLSPETKLAARLAWERKAGTLATADGSPRLWSLVELR